MALLNSTSTRPHCPRRVFGHPVDRLAVHQVHRDHQARPPERLDLGRRGLEAAGDGDRAVGGLRARRVGPSLAFAHGARRDDDIEAPTGQRQRPALPDATAGPGDQGDAAGLRLRSWCSTFPIYMIPAI